VHILMFLLHIIHSPSDYTTGYHICRLHWPCAFKGTCGLGLRNTRSITGSDPVQGMVVCTCLVLLFEGREAWVERFLSSPFTSQVSVRAMLLVPTVGKWK
jgi:hypothetical protein